MQSFLNRARAMASGLVLIAAFGSPIFADTSVSTATDPSMAMDSRLAAAFGQERAALGALAPGRMSKALVEPEAKPVAPPKRGKAASAVKMRVLDADWLAARPAPKGDEQWQCLTQALYFEARGEGIRGMVAVAEVVLNRVDSGRFPATICGVVNQSNEHGCQFSYTCDGQPEHVADAATHALAGRIARAMIDGAPRDLTGGATYFHTPKVNPDWSRVFERTATIGAHLFYRAG